jgi:hypothetical protein
MITSRIRCSRKMAVSALEYAHQHASTNRRHTHVRRSDLTQLEIAPPPPSEATLQTFRRKPLPELPGSQTRAKDSFGHKVSALHRSSSVRYQYPRAVIKEHGQSTQSSSRNQPPRPHAKDALSLRDRQSVPADAQAGVSSYSRFKIARKPVRGLDFRQAAAAHCQQRTIASGQVVPSFRTRTSTDFQDAALAFAPPERDALVMEEDIMSLSLSTKPPLRPWTPAGDLDSGSHSPFSSLDELREGTIRTSRATIMAPQTPRQQSRTPSLCSTSHCSIHSILKPSASAELIDRSNELESFFNRRNSANLAAEIDTESVYPASSSSSPLHAEFPYVPELFHGRRDARQLAADYRALLVEEMLDLQIVENNARFENDAWRRTFPSKHSNVPDCESLSAEKEVGHSRCQTEPTSNSDQGENTCKLEIPASVGEQRRDSGIAIPSPPPAPSTRLLPSDMHNKDSDVISWLCLDDTETPLSRPGPLHKSSPPHPYHPVAPPSIHPAFRTNPFHTTCDNGKHAEEHSSSAEDLTTLCYADFDAALKRSGLSAKEKLVAIEARICEIDRMLARSQERKEKKGIAV